jgi:hypothetical protein
MLKKRAWKVAAVVATAAVAAVFVGAAHATVSITKAEVNGTQLRLEGTAQPNATVTVDGVPMATSDAKGIFKIQQDPYNPPASCVVQVNDGSASATGVTLAGCSATAPPTVAPSLAKVAINPTDVIGGDSATGTVTLTSGAPAGGLQVALTSDDPVAATVPPSVTVPAGSTSANFPVATNVLSFLYSSLIIGTAGGVTTYGIITVWTPFLYANGSVGIVRGGGGNGEIISQPAGIDCILTSGGGDSGTCGAWFPVGTVVRLDARPAPDSSFLGWRPTPGCIDASKVTVFRGAFISCQPVFVLR